MTRIGALLLALCVSAALHRGATAHAEEPREGITVNPQTVKFPPVPGIPSCATAAPLRGDPSKGPSVLLVKLAAGCRVPWHWHTPNEEVLVVSGTGVLAMKDGERLQLHPGAYASLPSRHVHQASCSSACMFFNTADGVFDIHYVDETGKEIPPDEALKKPARGKARRKRA